VISTSPTPVRLGRIQNVATNQTILGTLMLLSNGNCSTIKCRQFIQL